MSDQQSRGSGQEIVAAAELRASHADRDRVVDLLGAAAGDGRLSPEELDDRVERALSAKTYAELASLTADLPTGQTVASAVRATPKDLVQIHAHSSVARRTGDWVVPKELDVAAISGTVTLDFTEAVITQPLLRITAKVSSGALTLITKPGIVVDVDEVSLRSSAVNLPKRQGLDVPVQLRIEITGSVHAGVINVHPPRPPRQPRRTFWQWLRRASRPRAIAA